MRTGLNLPHSIRQVLKILINRTTLYLISLLVLTSALIIIAFPRIPISIHNNLDLDVWLGLDLGGGTQITLVGDLAGVGPADQDSTLDTLDKARDVVAARLEAFGVIEPRSYTLENDGEYWVIVEVPRPGNVERIRSLIERPAKLDFRAFIKEIDPQDTTAYMLLENYQETGLTGDDFGEASVFYSKALQQPGQTGPSPQIVLTFTEEGMEKFAELTRQSPGKLLSVVLDGEIISTQLIPTKLPEEDADNIVIRGMFSPEQAEEIAIQLNSGPLPVALEAIHEKTIGPTLGSDSVIKGTLALVTGILIAMIFLLYRYQFPGLLANVALTLSVLLTIAVLKFIPITLTLAGLTGLMLSFWIAVGTNILVLSVIREELRKGSSFHNAMRSGFQGAWPSIRDSSVSVMILCIVLYLMGTCVMKGFALGLGIGISTSLFSVTLIGRTLLDIYRRYPFFERYGLTRFRT